MVVMKLILVIRYLVQNFYVIFQFLVPYNSTIIAFKLLPYIYSIISQIYYNFIL